LPCDHELNRPLRPSAQWRAELKPSLFSTQKGKLLNLSTVCRENPQEALTAALPSWPGGLPSLALHRTLPAVLASFMKSQGMSFGLGLSNCRKQSSNQ